MFNASVPVTAGGFFDRQEELRRLEGAVESLAAGQPKWVCLLGARKIGKTSLLLEVARRKARAGLAFVLVDAFEEVPATLEIFRRYALRALDSVLASDVGTALEPLVDRPAEFRSALLSSRRFVALSPALSARILEIPDLPLNPDGLRFLVDLPEKLAQAFDLHIVSGWDEFQEVVVAPTGRSGLEIPPLLRSLWQKHRRVSYVISGSARRLLEDLITSRHSPFFQHFELLRIEPFPRQEAVRLLVEGAPEGRPIPPGVAEAAHAAVGGHPFYLQLLGEALTAQPRSGSGPSLKDALGEILFSRTGRLALYFQNEFQRLVGRAASLAATLEALASGPRRLMEVASSIAGKSGATAGYLDRLGDAVVRGEDGLYRLSDPVFGLWLRWRRPGGTVLPTTLLGDEAEKLVAAELARMGFDLIYWSRASRGAFDLLATRGPNAIGVQVTRSALPLRFPPAAWKRMDADAARLGWRWMLAAVTPPPEGKVLFLDPARARRGKAVRVDSKAVIDNLLAWVDRGRGARKSS
jgi:AAA+ ATPase superfamily predicted ATPase